MKIESIRQEKGYISALIRTNAYTRDAGARVPITVIKF